MGAGNRDRDSPTNLACKPIAVASEGVWGGPGYPLVRMGGEYQYQRVRCYEFERA